MYHSDKNIFYCIDVVAQRNRLIRLGLILIIFSILRPSAVKCAFPFLPVKHDDNIPNKLDDDNRQNRLAVSIGPCKWIFNEKCPSSDIKFYLYTQKNPQDRQLIHVDEAWDKSNLSASYFNANDPTKIILHGYNSDMFLTPLIQMKVEYFDRGSYNLFFVDWSELARAPCYPSAVHNTKYAGECIGQLVNRIRDAGSENIHIIGFSLGAHVAGFAANQAKGFKVRRITALDPALPLFISAVPDDKLDASDADFVDVYHRNAFVQGQIEKCGTVDFYMNGGIDPFACSHHRAADYFTESIRSDLGFWGWPCTSYISYMLGLCPRTSELHLAGEDVRETSKGMFLITTNSESPFVSGQWSLPPSQKYPANSRRDPFLERIDEYGKLDSAFNFANTYHKLSKISSAATFRPYETLNNQINQPNEYEMSMSGDKTRIALDDDVKLRPSTERWRQNDKFILVENPLASAFNSTLPEVILHHHQQQQSGSNDGFQFPKVTYR